MLEVDYSAEIETKVLALQASASGKMVEVVYKEFSVLRVDYGRELLEEVYSYVGGFPLAAMNYQSSGKDDSCH